jgi:hypothetical protein
MSKLSPKEKAIELVNKFEKDFDFFHHCERGNTQFTTGKLDYQNQKQCAIILVNEIIKTICYCYPSKKDEISFVEYWEQVKQEIEKL